jgi:uncharacterized protein (DUF433 family)
MTMTIEPMTVPLTVDPDGTIRVGGTRLILDLVIHQFQQGASPEQIVQAYDVVRLADVYAVIAYYLNHQAEIDAYLAEGEEKARKWREYFAAQIPEEVRQRLRALRDRRAGTAG